jgi:acyl carrier protein
MSLLDIFSESARKQKKLDQLFASREPLDDQQFWQLYFQSHGVAPETVAKIRRNFSEILEVDFCRIRDTDDFTKELAFFWDFDSLADVQLVHSLEDEFGITVSDAEAKEMKTLRGIVLIVHAKITKSSA